MHFVNLGGQPTRSGNGFGYVEFMTDQTFADKVGFADPDGGGSLTVCELFERGLVNEVWVAEPSDDDAKLYEAKARGQRWSDDFTKIAGSFDDCSGNGCISPSSSATSPCASGDQPRPRPGLRDARVRSRHRGIGQTQPGAVPGQNATRFFNFDLVQRLRRLADLPAAKLSWLSEHGERSGRAADEELVALPLLLRGNASSCDRARCSSCPSAPRRVATADEGVSMTVRRVPDENALAPNQRPTGKSLCISRRGHAPI